MLWVDFYAVMISCISRPRKIMVSNEKKELAGSVFIHYTLFLSVSAEMLKQKHKHPGRIMVTS